MRRRIGTPAARRHRDRGTASLEFLGMLPILLLVALAGIQLGIVAYCGEQAGVAARAAARTAAAHAPHPDPQQVGRDAVSGWLQGNTAIDPPSDGGDDSVTVSATVQIPSVLPGVHLFGPVTRRATMPKEDTNP